MWVTVSPPWLLSRITNLALARKEKSTKREQSFLRNDLIFFLLFDCFHWNVNYNAWIWRLFPPTPTISPRNVQRITVYKCMLLLKVVNHLQQSCDSHIAIKQSCLLIFHIAHNTTTDITEVKKKQWISFASDSASICNIYLHLIHFHYWLVWRLINCLAYKNVIKCQLQFPVVITFFFFLFFCSPKLTNLWSTTT